MATPNLRRSQISEPAMRRIPEGWFQMGCDAGRDDEKPAHRVWVDAFELAALSNDQRGVRALLGRHAPSDPLALG